MYEIDNPCEISATNITYGLSENNIARQPAKSNSFIPSPLLQYNSQ